MRIALVALILGAAAGAGGAWLVLKKRSAPDAPAADPHEHANEQRTVWTDRYEIFLEHPEIEPGQPAEFLAHVTDLATGEPKTSGAINYRILHSDPLRSGGVDVPDPGPVKPGIYKTRMTFEAGHWRLELRVDSETIDLGLLHVHAVGEKHDHASEPAEGIRFLKEQQWKVLTRSEPVGKRTLVHRLRVPGIVTARPGSRSALTPPVEGRLQPPPGGKLPSVGERVEAGQPLALVHPPLSDFLARIVEAEADIVRTQVAHDQAEATAARLRRLVADKARPERELIDAEFALRSARAAHEAAQRLREAYAKSGAVLADGGRPAFEMRSPISGIVTRVSAAAGENVHTESPVFTILDPSRVWVDRKSVV